MVVVGGQGGRVKFGVPPHSGARWHPPNLIPHSLTPSTQIVRSHLEVVVGKPVAVGQGGVVKVGVARPYSGAGDGPGFGAVDRWQRLAGTAYAPRTKKIPMNPMKQALYIFMTLYGRPLSYHCLSFMNEDIPHTCRRA